MESRGSLSSRGAQLATRAEQRRGSETPRVFTPPLRELTEETTLGFDVIEFAGEILLVELYPWQKWFLIHLLELLPEGGLRFRTALLLVARQNGKSTISQVLALWFMIVWGWPRVLGTAQALDTAEEVWTGCVELLEDEDSPLAPLLKNVVRTNGKKSLDLVDGQKYRVKAANRRAGRGFFGNLVMLDELREHQSWAAWGAITKTTMAQAEALVLGLSNAGDVSSVVLRHLRKLAHRELGDPDGLWREDVGTADEMGAGTPAEVGLEDLDAATIFIAEWSAPPNAGKYDRDALAQANPAVGYGGFRWANIMAAAGVDDDAVYRTEVMCQWVDRMGAGPFVPGAWEAGKWHPDPPGSPVPQIRLPVKACVDVSADRQRAVIVVAGFREDGAAQLEVAAARAGVDWVEAWLDERVDQGVIDEITGQTNGAPVSPTLLDLKAAELPVTDWAGADLSGATGRIFDAVRDGLFVHLPQPILDLAAASALVRRTENGAILWDRVRSPHDAAPLVAATGAFWLLVRPVPDETSEYEDHDLLVV